jgi:RNAse (barnase) inhibitor barstar
LARIVMRKIVLDAEEWKTTDDVYTSFFRAVGAPEWHGRNFNALIDSIETGDINQIEVPYRLVITNYDRTGEGAQQMAKDFVDLIHEIADRGCPVDIRIEVSI